MPAFAPRSLLFLLLLGYACLAVPLGLGLHKASDVVSSIGGNAELLLQHGIDTARRSRALVSLTSDMERNARQFEVLRDPRLVSVYDQRHRRLLEELTRIGNDDADQELAGPVADLGNLAEYLHERLSEAQERDESISSSLPKYEQLVSLARAVEALGAERFDLGLADLGDSADNARDALFTQALFLVPISIALAVVFSALVLRPVRQLTGAIRALGEGRLGNEVVIQGPAEIASLGQEIEWLRARLAQSDEEKNGFLRRMSHELKTPLAGLREGTSLLADGSVGMLDARQQEVVGIMRECTARLDSQIHNLLAHSAASTASTVPRLERLRLDSAVTQVLRAHRLQVEAKRIQVDARLEPVAIMFDREQLTMALDNVIGNAIKYTPTGGRVGVALRMQRDRAELDVVDSGPGIAPEERDLVFKPFYQGSAAREAGQSGTGVGLSVVRECLDPHGASIKVMDTSNGGAHLRFSFKGVRRVR